MIESQFLGKWGEGGVILSDSKRTEEGHAGMRASRRRGSTGARDKRQQARGAHGSEWYFPVAKNHPKGLQQKGSEGRRRRIGSRLAMRTAMWNGLSSHAGSATCFHPGRGIGDD